MSKRKILMLALSLCMVAILAVGGTLAYFTSDDSATNVFTIGNVEIDLIEDYDQNSDLVPGLKINKDVFVENTGSRPAYVRVHMAFPAAMDDGDPAYNASKNFLHWNFESAAYADGLWSFLPEYSEGTGYKGNGVGNWNYYETEINGEPYAVYVATYRTAVAVEGKTELALTQVYLDATVDATANENGTVTYKDTNGNEVTLTAEEAANIKIYVVAEGTQVDTFENAYDALNTAFGVPGSYTVAWPTWPTAD
nr:SipW-dependent-type signal peptide-containing protein [Clostridia bacterium]